MADDEPIYKTLRAIFRAREEGKFSDLLLVCEDMKIPVHKIIVCPQSPVIDKACNGPFKEQETGIYQIKDASVDTVWHMVEYLYTGQYSPTSHPSSGEPCDTSYPIMFHARMSELADKYMIEGLQRLALSEFETAVQKELDVSTFLRSVAEIYSVPSASRDRLREYVVSQARCLLTTPNFDATVKEILDEVAGHVPQFAKDLLYSSLSSPRKCKRCGRSGKWISG